ncbi:MAG: hypothetical protein K8I27_12210 [Planctomycetes bacterium]|nr:hypothetical protein [Planctomycetota bacterium]
MGLVDGYKGYVVAEGLKNPSFVSFHPDGRLTICDSGNGRVLVVDEGKLTPVIENMRTEYWKVYKNDAGKEVKAFKIGPLAAHWLSIYRLVVTDAGLKDGEESLVTIHVSSDGPSANRELSRTNSVPPTSTDPADKGEGNLSGMCVMPDGDTYYVCGQGYDGKSWVLGGSLSKGTLEPMFSADENKIDVNSPMQVVPWNNNLLVVYSGAGGEDDGLLVEWNPVTRKPVRQWKLTGLLDPMSIAQVPGTSSQFVVTDNNWSLTGINPGRLALVTINDDTATIRRICDRIYGPVHCAFGPDGRLYVSCLGYEVDGSAGQVISISGFSRQ